MNSDGETQFARRLPAQVIAHAARDKFRAAGNAKAWRREFGSGRLDPDGAALVGSVNDEMSLATHGYDRAGLEAHGLWQSAEARLNPGDMALREFPRAGDGRTPGHGEHDVARRRAHAQGETLRASHATQAHGNDRIARAKLERLHALRSRIDTSKFDRHIRGPLFLRHAREITVIRAGCQPGLKVDCAPRAKSRMRGTMSRLKRDPLNTP